MNPMHRNRIWEMVFRSLTDKTKFQISKDNKEQKQIVDHDEIIKGFKESIQKSVSD